MEFLNMNPENSVILTVIHWYWIFFMLHSQLDIHL